MRHYLIILLLGLLLGFLSACKPPARLEAVQLEIEPVSRYSYSEFHDKIASPHALKSIGYIEQINVWQVEVKTADKELLLKVLQQNPEVKVCEVSQEMQLYSNDPMYSQQDYLFQLSVDKAWGLLKDYTNEVDVVVIDSGVNPGHEDMGENVKGGYNAVSVSNINTEDGSGHGTSVAGVIAAIANNGKGIAGIGGNAKIIPIRVEDSKGKIYQFNIARALVYAADRRYRVANLSLGSFYSSVALEKAVNYAAVFKVILVAAAGNEGTDKKSYPAAYNKVLSISAINQLDMLTWFSNRGDWIDFCAPGDRVLSTSANGGYKKVSGTSFSSPICAGVVALLLRVNPNLTYDQVYDILKRSSYDLGLEGYDRFYGWGRIDAHKAVQITIEEYATTH